MTVSIVESDKHGTAISVKSLNWNPSTNDDIAHRSYFFTVSYDVMSMDAYRLKSCG